MRKFLYSLLFVAAILALTYPFYSPTLAQVAYSYRILSPPGQPTASGSSIWYNTSSTGTTYASLQWTPVGTFSGCTVQIDYSNDGSTVAGQLITAQTCTSSGSIISGSTSTPPWVRVSYTLTGGTYLKYVAQGCTSATCSTSSGGSVTSIATTSPITGGTITTTGTIACATCGVTGSPLSQFASTTSLQFLGIISDHNGTGTAVFGTSPTLTTPNIGVATATSINLASSGAMTTVGFNNTATAHSLGIYEGTATAQNLLACGAGTTLNGASGADPTCVANPTLGVAGTTQGQVILSGSTSGTLALVPSNTATQLILGASGAGGIQAGYWKSTGTKFSTDTGCGTIVTSHGGATAGDLTTVGSTSCTVVITFGNSATAATSWACFAHDITTAADYNNPRVTNTTTTASIITGTIVSGDVIQFACVGY